MMCRTATMVRRSLRQRLLRRDQLEALLLDVVALVVDVQVVGDDLAREVDVAVLQGVDGALDGRLDHVGHDEHVLLDLAELPFEGERVIAASHSLCACEASRSGR